MDGRGPNGNYSIFTVVAGSTVEIDGLTMTHGFRIGQGGGIVNDGGTLTISNSSLTNNYTVSTYARGGAIFNNGGTLTIENSTLADNFAYGQTGSSFGGAIFSFGGIVTIENSTLSGNYCYANSNNGLGGGIYNFGGTLSVSDSTLSDNRAGGGGGIFNPANSQLTVIGSTLVNNSIGSFYSDESGGGISNFGTLMMVNSTVSGNSSNFMISSEGGAGLSNGGGMATVINSTFTGNSSNYGVGGIRNTGAGTLSLYNSIVANSQTGGDILGSYTGSNNLFGTVPLGPLQDNGGPVMTHALPASSLANDAGDNNLVPVDITADQRGDGFSRIFNGTVDIGAFERQVLGYDSITDLTSDANPATFGQTVTLTATVTSTAGLPTGTVSFLDNGLWLDTVSLIDGVAQFTTLSLTGGDHEITAQYNSDLNFLSSSLVLTQIVNKVDQTFDFGSLPDGSYNGDPFTPPVTASSGLPVSLAVLSGPAVLAGDRLSIIGVGTVVISASQEGDGNFNATIVNHTFAVNYLTSTGRLDLTFGDGGRQIIDFSDLRELSVALYGIAPLIFNDKPTGVVVQADGTILVVGRVDDEVEVGIATILTPDGGLTYNDFNESGLLTPTALQIDGKTIVVGAREGDFLVQRFNTDNSLDTSFGNGGSVTIDFGSSDEVATGVAVQPDGKIVVVGYSYQNSTGSYDFAVARLEGLDPTAVGTEGDDDIVIEPGTQAGSLKITVNGVVTDNLPSNAVMLVEGRGGNDTFTITASPAAYLFLAGQGGSDIYDVTFGNLAGTVVIDDDGTSGTDQFTAHGTAGDDEIFKDDTQVTWGDGDPVLQTIRYSGIESLTIHGEAGNDTIIDPGRDTYLFGDAGDDTFLINATSGSGVTVDGGDGSDTYIIGGGTLAGPVTLLDSGTSGTDRVTILAGPDDLVEENGGDWSVNGTAVYVGAGLEIATVDFGPPVITALSGQRYTETGLAVQVEADDPDGADTLTYSVSFVSRDGAGQRTTRQATRSTRMVSSTGRPAEANSASTRSRSGSRTVRVRSPKRPSS